MNAAANRNRRLGLAVKPTPNKRSPRNTAEVRAMQARGEHVPTLAALMADPSVPVPTSASERARIESERRSKLKEAALDYAAAHLMSGATADVRNAAFAKLEAAAREMNNQQGVKP